MMMVVLCFLVIMDQIRSFWPQITIIKAKKYNTVLVIPETKYPDDKKEASAWKTKRKLRLSGFIYLNII